MVKLELTEREFDVILAALRNLEFDLEERTDSCNPVEGILVGLDEIAHAHNKAILRHQEVAQLAERINLCEPPPPPPRHNLNDRSFV